MARVSRVSTGSVDTDSLTSRAVERTTPVIRVMTTGHGEIVDNYDVNVVTDTHAAHPGNYAVIMPRPLGGGH